MAGAGVTTSGAAGAAAELVAGAVLSGGTFGTAGSAAFAGTFSTGLLSVVAAVVAGGGEGVPVYSIFSQQPTHDAASSSKLPRDKMTNCWGQRISILYGPAETMKRQPQYLFFAATLAFCWLAMQAVHEIGHMSAALLSGGHVVRVILHPATFSYTQLSRNPHPNLVTWMGPIIGTIVPIALLLLARALRWRGWYVFRFFAGFCFIANGVYIAFGSLGNIGDAGDLLRHGSPIYLLWMFGAITIPIGLWLWNGLEPHFGLGPNASTPDPMVCYVVTALLVIVVLLELLLSTREVVA